MDCIRNLVIDAVDKVYDEFCLLPMLVQQRTRVWRLIGSLLSPLRDIDVLGLSLQGRGWTPPLQKGDFLFAEEGVDAVDGLQVLHLVVVGGYLVEVGQRVIYDLVEGESDLLCLDFTVGVGPLRRLAALLEHVLPSLGEQSQLGIQLLPKLDEPFELEPSHVLDVLGADADADPLLVVYELVDDFEEGVHAVDLLEEALRIDVVLVEVEGRQDIDEQLVQVDAPQHTPVGEGFKVVINGLFFLEEDPLEENVAVVVGVELLYDGAALRVHAQPLFDHVAQLLGLQGLEVDLDGDVLLNEVVEQRVLHPALDLQEAGHLLGEGSQVDAAGV